MSVRAVLFDLDGTLTNTLQDIADAMNRALALHGLPGWETDEYKYLVGNGARILAQRAVRERQDLSEAVLADYQAWYETHALVTTRPYPGIPELLAELQRQGIPLCVLSNKPDADTKHVVAHFFPGIRFACVRGQLPGVPVKPDPGAALVIARQMAVNPGDFLYLGDTAVDMTCARQAGMRPVGVLWGFRKKTELLESGAEFLIREPMDLIPALTDL